jgi:hypothetical protein
MAEIGFKVPLFFHTSEMLSFHNKTNEYNLYRYRGGADNKAFLYLSEKIVESIEKSQNMSLPALLNSCANLVGIYDLKIRVSNGTVYINPGLKHQERTALIHAIGFSGILK